jgi:hypothetical protein
MMPSEARRGDGRDLFTACGGLGRIVDQKLSVHLGIAGDVRDVEVTASGIAGGEHDALDGGDQATSPAVSLADRSQVMSLPAVELHHSHRPHRTWPDATVPDSSASDGRWPPTG